MADRALALDRDYRRQVRKAYYLRRDNFAADIGYNNYLEEVEDLVEELVNEQTRAAARAKLDQLRSQWAAQTAENLALHDHERRRREDTIEQEKAEAQQAAQARLEAEQRKAVAAEQARLSLQQEITTDGTTLHNARAELSSRTAAALERLDAAAAARPPPQPGGRADGYADYLAAGSASAAPPEQQMVQPIDRAAAEAKQKAAPAFMQQSIKAQAEAYESDSVLLRTVRIAGGYDDQLWRQRYRQEALCI